MKKNEQDPINTMKLEIAARSINESFARTTVAAFASQLNPTLDEIDDIKTAVSEAVTNSIVHAYGEGIVRLKGVHLPSTDYLAPTIVIEAELYPDCIDIRVTDKGQGIDDVNKAMQPFHTSKPSDERSGMGFTVMQYFMDSIKVSSRPNKGTTITMRKFVSAQKKESLACGG